MSLLIDNILCRIREFSSILQEFKNEDGKNRIILSEPSTLTYLFYEISWSPVYIINLKNETGSFSLNASIKSKQNLDGEFTLMAGTFNKPVTARASASLQEEQREIPGEKFSEYHSYDLGYLEINMKEQKSIHIFSRDELEVSKFYSHDVGSKNVVVHK